jgi:8-oxo-dGTP pyrophosphatase MutT (NUDIX family)
MLSLFDPKRQPWVPSSPPFSAAPHHALTPDALRRVLGAKIERVLHIPDESKRRLPGREGELLEAAVLVPLVLRQDGVTVLLTQRAAHLNDHAGQISFPGGRIEHSDADEVAAALRETEEETGLMRDYVEVLGTLPRYFTSSGFAINPVTALVQPGFTLSPDNSEVAEVFEVPLSFVTNPANYRLHSAVLPDGAVRQFYSAPWQDYFIWGATAAMLFGLTQVLSEAHQIK